MTMQIPEGQGHELDDTTNEDNTAEDQEPTSAERPVGPDTDPVAVNDNREGKDSEKPEEAPETIDDFEAKLSNHEQALASLTVLQDLIEQRRIALGKIAELEKKRPQQVREAADAVNNPIKGVRVSASMSNNDLRRLVKAGVLKNFDEGKALKEKLIRLQAVIDQYVEALENALQRDAIEQGLAEAKQMLLSLVGPIRAKMKEHNEGITEKRETARAVETERIDALVNEHRELLIELNQNPVLREYDENESLKAITGAVDLMSEMHDGVIGTMSSVLDVSDLEDRMEKIIALNNKGKRVRALNKLRSELAVALFKNPTKVDDLVPWASKDCRQYLDSAKVLQSNFTWDSLSNEGTEELRDRAKKAIAVNLLLRQLIQKKKANNELWSVLVVDDPIHDRDDSEKKTEKPRRNTRKRRGNRRNR